MKPLSAAMGLALAACSGSSGGGFTQAASSSAASSSGSHASTAGTRDAGASAHASSGSEARSASATVDGGGAPPTDPDTAQWLTPMNAARGAVGDKPLAWDPIAAQVATTYAAMCDFEHNPNASEEYDALGGGDAGLGENIAAGTTPESPATAVADWISEESDYDEKSNTCALFKECGHYTQIVWSTSTGVGCAHVTCSKNSPFGGGDWDFSVCDFSPPGNYEGERPY